MTVQENISAYLMEHGVLKNDWADKCAREICLLFAPAIAEVVAENDKLRERVKQLEADCASMREALRDAQMHIEADNIDWARFQEGPDHDPNYKPTFPEIVERCAKALSTTDAGKSLLDRLQAVEAERDLYKAALEEFGQHKPLCEHNDMESPLCTCGFSKALQPTQKDAPEKGTK